MIDHSKWKQKNSAAVTSLQLDNRNPRLPPRSPNLNQAELIAELIRHENVYGMAKRIVDRGYYRHELPIAVEEGGKLVVVEGNRRLCALKLLISPNLAPDADRSRFKKLSHKASISQIRKIPVLIAPSRDAAAPAIQSKHTQDEVESWSPVMQARFYADRIADGNTITDLANEFSIPSGQILDFLQNYQMYQIACALDLPADVAAKVKDPRSFPLTNLERIYRNTEAAEFLGISFDANRELKGHIAADEFKKAFKKVVADVALGETNSRKLNTSDDFKKYLGKFGSDAPDKSKKGSFTTKDILGPTGKVAAMPKQILPLAPKPPKPQVSLLSKSFVCGIEDVRINAIIKDLKKISVDEHPNAVALTLRGLVDLAVGDYCDRVGATTAIVTKAKTKDNKGADWYPTVRQMLNHFVGESKTLSLHPLALKAAKILIDDKNPVSVLMLDAFAHNKYVIPTPSELRSFWAKIEEAIKAMLTPETPHA